MVIPAQFPFHYWFCSWWLVAKIPKPTCGTWKELIWIMILAKKNKKLRHDGTKTVAQRRWHKDGGTVRSTARGTTWDRDIPGQLPMYRPKLPAKIWSGAFGQSSTRCEYSESIWTWRGSARLPVGELSSCLECRRFFASWRWISCFIVYSRICSSWSKAWILNTSTFSFMCYRQ